MWNFLLVVLSLLLVVYVYRREGRPRSVRIALGALRLLLLLFVILMLNRPVLTLQQKYTEPSVLAILIDDSISMRVRDALIKEGDPPATRLQAAEHLLSADDYSLLRALSARHTLRFYRFSQDAQAMGTYSAASGGAGVLFGDLQPAGQHTQVINSLRTVLGDLQGQRIAGIVLLTDGRDTPAQSSIEALAALKEFGVRVYPIPLGTDTLPKNIDVQSVSVQDTAFKGDIVNLKATVRATGFEPDHPVKLTLKDKKTGLPLLRPDGSPVSQAANLPANEPVEVELQFKPAAVGPLDVVVEAEKQPGELDDQDNTRLAQLTVLDAQIVVLYVDGLPRWEYRYVKNEMMRDKTVLLSCLLTSADPSFAQEGTKPIKQFPVNMDQLMEYDVVVFGDVDPRQFTDAQLQMVSDFVSRKGGGFGMVAGPQFSPQAYRNTAIEPILPVNISQSDPRPDPGPITQGFRPVLTRDGAASSIFRFLPGKDENERYIKTNLPPLFWYCRGITAKPGVGEVYAEHPLETAPDGRKSPLLVLGRFGAGRTLFSAIDDSWRWRFYTGESVFDTYWVQQLRYLARSKKLGQRRLVFTSLRPAYELGRQIRLNLRILDPQLAQQLPPSFAPKSPTSPAKSSARKTSCDKKAKPNSIPPPGPPTASVDSPPSSPPSPPAWTPPKSPWKFPSPASSWPSRR